jgi:hypothetical protein
MPLLSAVKFWIWLSALATLAGWTLSTFGVLNKWGYIGFAVVVAVVMIEASARGALKLSIGQWRWQKIRARFRRPFPLMFAALALLVFFGGLIYPPSNHTGLSYRIPRVLHWLNAEGWHWIYTPDQRLNLRACGIEWLSAPLLLFTKSDRALFLLNFIPFLLMPGLLFSMLTRLGVRARVAWHWMWLMPTGFVFLLQAGSINNDAFPTVYAIAAIDFACRAWKSRHASDLGLSLLAIALLGGAKASNLPLVLPWLVLAVPLWKLLKEKPLSSARVLVLAMIVSFLPTALLNISHCGSWSGLQLERPGMDMKNPVIGILGNAFLLLLNNLCPPLFPFAGWWSQNALRILPGAIVQPMVANFEDGFHFLWELATEDWVGIGLGLTVLMIISAAWTFSGFFRERKFPVAVRGMPSNVLKLAVISPWLALLAYCAKSGMVTAARLIAPYYPLLLPLLIVGVEQTALVRRRWWRGLIWATFIVAFAVLIVTPARPLWPAQTILRKILQADPDNRLVQRALTTYAVYEKRNDPLAPLRSSLPAEVKEVGFVAMADDLDISLWRPFGQRRVAHVSRVASIEEIRARKIQYAVVSKLLFELHNESVDDWLARIQAEVITNATFTVTVSAGPRQWYVVRFKDEPVTPKNSN